MVENGAERIATIATGDSLVLEDLSFGTNYSITVSVQGLCSEDDHSEVSTKTIRFNTVCESYDVPFSETFDDAVTSSYALPVCWTKVKSNGNYPYENSNGYLYFYGGTSSTYQIAALPEMSLPLNSLTLNLNYKNNNSSSGYANFVIGIYSDLNNAFVPLDTLDKVTTATDYELILTNAPANARYLAIYYGGGTTSAAGYIYSLSLTETPKCVPVKDLQVNNVSRREFDIQWTPKLPADSYDLIISTESLDSTALAQATPISLDTTGYHASGLTRGMTYYIYVRTNCGAKDGVSEWFATSVTTKQIGPDCSKSAPGEISLTGSGSAYGPVSCYYKNSYTEQLYTAAELQAAGLKAGYVSSVAFQYLLSSSYTKDVTVYVGSTTDAAVTSAFYMPEAASEAQSITFDTPNKWYEIDLTNPYYWDGTSNLIIGVDALGTNYWSSGVAGFAGGNTTNNSISYARSDSNNPRTNSTTGSTSTARPNIKLSICPMGKTCPATDEASYELLGDGTTSAKISWSSSTGDYANTYEFCYADNDTIQPDDIAQKYTDIDRMSITLTGLSEDVQYYGYIRTVCDAEGQDDGSSNWYPMLFKTASPCPAVVDMHAELTGKTSATVSWNTTHPEQEKTFRYVLTTEAMDSAMLANTSLQEVDTTMLAWDTLTCGKTYYLYVVSRCGADQSKFNHVSWTQTPHCPAVQNLHVVSTEYNSVQLAWDRGQFGEETAWEVGVIGREDEARIVSDLSAQVIGLMANHMYTAYVRAVCSENESSELDTLRFTTDLSLQEIGNGTSSDYNVPFCSYYQNGWNQMIYPSTSIGMGGAITSIAYHCANLSQLTDTLTRIYMGHTDKTVATSTSDWVPLSDLQEVYRGSITHNAAAGSWLNIPLQTPFDYNGTDNLVIVVSSMRTGYSSSLKYYYTTAANGSVLYRQSDSNTAYAEHPGTNTGTLSTFLPNIRLTFDSVGCNRVLQLAISHITKTSADASWYPGGVEMRWNTLLSTTELDSAQLATAPYDTVEVYTKQLTGLEQDVDYYFYVRPMYSDTVGLWSMISFISEANCKVPISVSVDSVSSEGALLHCQPRVAYNPLGYQVAYGLKDSIDWTDESSYRIVALTDTFVLLTGLDANTEYEVYFREICTQVDTSRWTEPVYFTTRYRITLPYLQNFDDTNDRQSVYGTSDNKIPQGWKELYANTSYISYLQSGSSCYYSHSGSAALRMYSRYGYSNYVVLPQLVDSLEGLQLRFKARAMYGTSSMTNYATSSYARNLKIGYLTNPDDQSTFHLLQEYHYPVVKEVSAQSDDPECTNYWRDVVVPLQGGAGKYLVLMSDSSLSNRLYIDDLEIGTFDANCRGVDSLQVLHVTSSAADIQFRYLGTGAQDALVEVATDAAYTQLVETDTLSNQSNLYISNLQASTTYYVRVQQLCGSEEESDYKQIRFTTAEVLPFLPDFSGTAANWTARKYNVSTADSTFLSSDFQYGGSWSVVSADTVINAKHLRNEVYYTGKYDWRLTPAIDLTEQQDKNLVLRVDLGLTPYSASAVSSRNNGTDDRFVIYVSEDGGTSWNQANAIVWNNDSTGDYGYNAIPEKAQTYAINLNRYAGKVIQLGFYVESTVSNADNYLHLGNISLTADSINDDEWAIIQRLSQKLHQADGSHPFHFNNRLELLNSDRVTTDGGHVVSLNLSNMALVDTVPMEACLLPQLTRLDLSENGFSDLDTILPPHITTLDLTDQSVETGRVFNTSTLTYDSLLQWVPRIFRYNHSAQGYDDDLPPIIVTPNPNYKALTSSDFAMHLSLYYEDLSRYAYKDNVYRGQRGDSIYLMMLTYSNYSYQSYGKALYTHDFTDGDANMQGGVTATDLQATANYELSSNYTSLFNLTAADTYRDDRITVQDIICTARILLNQSVASAPVRMSTIRRMLAGTAEAEAHIYVDNGQVILSTTKPVAALCVSTDRAIHWAATDDMDQLKRDNRLVIYSLVGNTLPIGETVLGTCSEGTQVVDASLSDIEAEDIPFDFSGSRGIVTALDEVSQGRDDSHEVYDVLGRKTRELQRGVNIIRKDGKGYKVVRF